MEHFAPCGPYALNPGPYAREITGRNHLSDSFTCIFTLSYKLLIKG